jgi:hypothetical protein
MGCSATERKRRIHSLCFSFRTSELFGIESESDVGQSRSDPKMINVMNCKGKGERRYFLLSQSGLLNVYTVGYTNILLGLSVA